MAVKMQYSPSSFSERIASAKIIKKRKKNVKPTTEEFKERLSKFNPNITVLGEYDKSDVGILCECKRCGHRWRPTPDNLFHGRSCPKCCHIATSFTEQFILESLRQVLGSDKVISRDKCAIGEELDIYIPSYRFAIEYGAWYWHKKRLAKDNEKATLCKNNNIHILFIYDLCPLKDSPVDSECLIYSYSLSEKSNREKIKELVLWIFNRLRITKNGSAIKKEDIDWETISNISTLNSRKKTTEEFRKELAGINNSITVLGEYADAHTKIRCRCNNCGREWNPTPNDLLCKKGCPSCARVKKRFHFAKYNTESFKEKMAEINPDIAVLGEYINANAKILCKCKKCEHIWNPTPDKLQRGQGCPVCAGNYKIDTDIFIKRLKTVNPNIEVMGEYVNAKTKIHCKCKICEHEWYPTPDSLLSGHGCPACAGNRKMDTSLFINRLSVINPNIEVLGEYKNISTNIPCKCKICGHEWSPKPNHLLNGHGCPTRHNANRSPNSKK